MTEVAESAHRYVVSGEELFEQTGKVRGEINLVGREFILLTEEQYNSAAAWAAIEPLIVRTGEAMREINDPSLAVAAGLGEISVTAGVAAGTTAELAFSLGELSVAEAARLAIANLDEAMEAGTISTADRNEAVSALLVGMGLASAETMAQVAAIDSVTQAYIDGETSQSAFADRLERIANETSSDYSNALADLRTANEDATLSIDPLNENLDTLTEKAIIAEEALGVEGSLARILNEQTTPAVTALTLSLVGGEEAGLLPELVRLSDEIEPAAEAAIIRLRTDAFEPTTAAIRDGSTALGEYWGHLDEHGRKIKDVAESWTRWGDAIARITAKLEALGPLHEHAMRHGGIQTGDTPLQGGRAIGGAVTAGGAYTVGEQGAELFVPSQNGMILPHGAAGGVSIGTVVVNGVRDARSFVPELRRVLRNQGMDFAKVG